MLTLRCSPGACSTASHLAMKETAEPYIVKETPLATDAQRSAEYLAINPRSKGPR